MLRHSQQTCQQPRMFLIFPSMNHFGRCKIALCTALWRFLRCPTYILHFQRNRHLGLIGGSANTSQFIWVQDLWFMIWFLLCSPTCLSTYMHQRPLLSPFGTRWNNSHDSSIETKWGRGLTGRQRAGGRLQCCTFGLHLSGRRLFQWERMARAVVYAVILFAKQEDRVWAWEPLTFQILYFW